MTGRHDFLNRLFTPRTIAVVGASNDERKKGSLVLRNLRRSYRGEIFAVHPTADTVDGLAVYRSVADIPTEIDLLIPLIPAQNLVDLVRDCPPDHVKTLLAIPSGFGEIPPDGARIEREMVSVATSKGMRVVGPNTVGMMNCGNGLNASLAPALPGGPGGFSCVTQSGGFGMAIYMYGIDNQLDMAKFCDLGNTSDVSIGEVLEYYLDDPSTTIIGAFLESYPNQLAASITRTAKEKPLILTTIGRTSAGRRASLAHLGIAPGPNPVMPAPGSHSILAQTGSEMLDIVKALTWQPLPRGTRVGILTGSGGIGVELADLCVEHGLEVPELSPALQRLLRSHLPPYASVVNPVDLTPAWPDYPEMYPPLMKALLDSDEIDMLIITVIDVATSVARLMEAVGEFAHTYSTDTKQPKPVLTYWAAPPGFRHHRQLLQAARVPCYPSTLSTVRVAAAISKYAGRSFRVPD